MLKFFFNRERKYLDNDYWFRLSRKQAKVLGLDKSPPLDILDVGLGSGHFVAVCRELGHRCVGLDQVGSSKFIKTVRESIGVDDVIESTIAANTPFPEIGKFDLVTTYRCRFYYVAAEGRPWSTAEWNFFLDDLRDNVLKPGGRFVLQTPTRGRAKWNEGTGTDVIELLEARGATTVGNVLVFAPLR